MSKNYALQAEKREQAGKGAARSLRRASKTPAVIYGDKKEPVKISLDTNTINVEYRKGRMFTTLCDLDVSGDKHLVLVRDVQLHPVTDIVEHVDFLRVTAKTRIAVMVPVNFINHEKSKGITQKGILNVTRHQVEVTVLANNIPDQIEVNLEGKLIGDSVKSSDAILPEGAKFVIDNRDFTIATIAAPKTADQEAAEEAEADAELAKPIADDAAADDAGDKAEGEASEEAKAE
ncbi:MAG: 50S ribosomal protein L25/general stress protein Ctc [Alphaproteobacteria bacterium]